MVCEMKTKITVHKLYLIKFYSPYQQLALLYQKSHAKKWVKVGARGVVLEVTLESSKSPIICIALRKKNCV